MMAQIYKLMKKRFPKNYILKNPLTGSLLFLVFCFGFTNIYRPLNTHESQSLGYAATMAIYCSVFSVFLFAAIKLLNRTHYFSDDKEWTFLKEIVAIFLALSVVGMAIFFMGFFMEAPHPRWNLPTFFNSYIIAFLLGIFPFVFFTLSNYRHLFVSEITQQYESGNVPDSTPNLREEKIQIGSRLKKEELSFYPGQFIYAESDGNYVVFYLKDQGTSRKVVIRNSISEIEQQLSPIPYFTRTHRAFIVNVKKVSSKKGNTLGYRLRLAGTDAEIPVSRQNISAFDQVMKQYSHPSVTKNYHS